MLKVIGNPEDIPVTHCHYERTQIPLTQEKELKIIFCALDRLGMRWVSDCVGNLAEHNIAVWKPSNLPLRRRSRCRCAQHS